VYERILVPTDGSLLADRAVKEAAMLARTIGATLTLFHVAPNYRPPIYAEGMVVPQYYLTPESHRRGMRAHAHRLLDSAARRAGGTVTRRICEFSDQPHEAIIAAARKQRSDLIVMASHGWSGLKGLLLGGETQKVLTHSRVPVLVVR
jgi:nucleotide-binding universal stress UspA family protein